MTPDEQACIRKLIAATAGLLSWIREGTPIGELPRAERLRHRMAALDEALTEARAVMQ
jgi:hypothetical protein